MVLWYNWYIGINFSLEKANSRGVRIYVRDVFLAVFLKKGQMRSLCPSDELDCLSLF